MRPLRERRDDRAERAQPPRVETSAAELPETLQFMRVLWALVHGLERTSKRMQATVGVTGPQRLVIRVVGLFPGLTPGDLARLLHVHPSTLTGVLQRLLSQRLLDRVADAADRRRSRLDLTAAGRRVNGTMTGTAEEAIAQVLAASSPHDRAAARRLLTRLADRLQSDPE